jgi:hypothetical protein
MLMTMFGCLDVDKDVGRWMLTTTFGCLDVDKDVGN